MEPQLLLRNQHSTVVSLKFSVGGNAATENFKALIRYPSVTRLRPYL
jgi:hypothetical protein